MSAHDLETLLGAGMVLVAVVGFVVGLAIACMRGHR